MILAGDIGGTNPRLAFFEGTPDRLKTIVIEVFPSGEHDGPAAIAKEFLVKHKQKVDAACFGIAGAVVDGRVKTPNLPWEVDDREIAAELGLKQVELGNDLLANANGMPLLHPSGFYLIKPGSANRPGNSALFSAGL